MVRCRTFQHERVLSVKCSGNDQVNIRIGSSSSTVRVQQTKVQCEYVAVFMRAHTPAPTVHRYQVRPYQHLLTVSTRYCVYYHVSEDEIQNARLPECHTVRLLLLRSL